VGHIDYDWSNIDNRTGSISFGSQETQMEQSTARYHAANNNQFSEQTDRSDFISQPATGVVLPPNNTALDDAEYEAFCASSLDFKNCIWASVSIWISFWRHVQRPITTIQHKNDKQQRSDILEV